MRENSQGGFQGKWEGWSYMIPSNFYMGAENSMSNNLGRWENPNRSTNTSWNVGIHEAIL